MLVAYHYLKNRFTIKRCLNFYFHSIITISRDDRLVSVLAGYLLVERIQYSIESSPEKWPQKCFMKAPNLFFPGMMFMIK